MKKLLSVFAAVAMLFSFASCSGDLHDDVKIDPNAMKGYWSYRVLSAADVAPSGEVAVIANCDAGQTGAYGSPDFKVPATAGTVNYLVWDGIGGTNFTVSGRTDAPTIDLGDGEFGICVFTPYVTVNLYCYGGEGTDDAWPGVEATATAVAQPVSYYVSAVKLVGYEMQGSAIYALEGWVPGNDWGEGSPNKTSVAESDGSYLITFDTPAKMETTDLDLPNATIKVQIIDFIDETNFWADGNKVEGGSNVAKVPADAKDKTYTLVVTYSAEGNTAELR
jgi:hypothetical protein